MNKIISTIAALSIAFLVPGCAVLAQKDVSRIQARHGVNIEITSAGAAADLLGGNSLLALSNVDKELEHFPYRAKEGINIHIGAGLDILAESKTLGDILSAP